MSANPPSGPRSIALVGPYLSGKTTLLESILFVTGKVHRQGKVTEGSSVGDSSQESRDRGMSVEVSVATTEFVGSTFTFLDCPGSIEFGQESADALMGVDAAVVVCEAEPEKVSGLLPIFKRLDDLQLPRFVFVNKIDRATGTVRDMLVALQETSSIPLVLRQVPIRNGEQITGYVDLASERAYVYKQGEPSERVEIPANMADRKAEARYEMLEKLADFDDKLMEELLEDIEPPPDEVFPQLSKSLAGGVVAPVLLGAAEHAHGVHRLLKALRHESPASTAAAKRRNLDGDGDPVAQVLKTYHTARGGKLSVARIWRGKLKDGANLNGERVSGMFRMLGQQTEKVAEAVGGDIVGLGRLEAVATGDTLTPAKDADVEVPRAEVHQPVYALSIHATDRNDEVKLSGSIAKLLEEDRSLKFFHENDTNEWVLSGAGEMHLRVAADRLKNKSGLAVEMARPKVPYKEAIQKPVTQHARFKRQSGGHGQFGDVELAIKPLPRGSGIEFENASVGGVVPKSFIPAVEAGVREYLKKGPLGFPVVDLLVTLTDGQHHSVDSSEIAFKTAGRMAMQEGTPKCSPVLLEPILHVDIAVPSKYTSKVNSLISGRRGQILGFDARDGWAGWDVVSAQIPQADTLDLIIELRSLTAGVGTYESRFDHLQELIGRLADNVVSAHKPPE
ncbi:elongation factor G [Polaribacter sp.]|nr:elongation factor G [Polaribacter sp.]